MFRFSMRRASIAAMKTPASQPIGATRPSVVRPWDESFQKKVLACSVSAPPNPSPANRIRQQKNRLRKERFFSTSAASPRNCAGVKLAPAAAVCRRGRSRKVPTWPAARRAAAIAAQLQASGE